MERTVFGMVLAKKESPYGTDAAPTGGLNLIAVTRKGVKFGPKFNHLTRQLLDGTLSKVSGLNAMPEVDFSFDVEVRGNRTDGSTADISSGAIAHLIEIDCLLQACDLAASYTAESQQGARDGYVTYKPTVPSDEGVSVTFYFYSGNKLHKIVGCKGTVKVSMTAGQMGVLTFDFKGVYVDVVDSGLPAAGNYLATVAVAGGGTGYAVGNVLTLAGGTAVTAATVRVTAIGAAGVITAVKILNVGLYSVNPSSPNSATGGGGTTASLTVTFAAQTAGVFLNTKPPVFLNSGSTIDSYSPVFQKLDADLGNTVTRREDANAPTGVVGFMVTDRDAKCSVDPESVAEATHPIWDDLANMTPRTITGKIGTQSGNKFQITLAGVSTGVSYGDRSGIRTQPIEYSVERANVSDSAGNEFQLKFY